MKNSTEYFQDSDHYSASDLKLFRLSPAAFYHAKVLRDLPPKETTARLNLGTACHINALENHTWHDRVAVLPEGLDRRTSAGRKQYAEFVESAEGKVILTAQEAATAEGVGKAFRDCSLISPHTLFAKIETPITWTNHLGMACKALPDAYDKFDNVIVDLKTVQRNGPDFHRAVVTYQYWLQMAHYRAATNGARFIWVTVELEPPHLVRVIELDDTSLEFATELYSRLLDDLQRCVETGNWGLEPTAVEQIRLPSWFVSENAS